MNIIFLVFLALTVVCLVFGFLFGLIRGAKNGGIRLLTVVVSAIGAILLRGTFVGLIKDIKVGGQTIGGAINSVLASGEFMESINSIINELTDILIGLVVYVLLFYALRMVTWLIIYLPVKAIVKGHDKKTGKKKKHLLGGLIGIVQGIVCAFCVCAPLTGVVVQAQVLAEVSFTENGNTQSVMELPKKINPDGYNESFLGKFYDKAGKWYFTILTKAESGRTLEDSISAFSSVSKMAREITEITGMVKNYNLSEGLSLDDAKELKNSFDKLQEISNSTSSESKQIIRDVLNDVAENIAGEDFPVNIPDNFDFSNIKFGEIGDAAYSIANINNNGTASQEDADTIVKALIDNDLIVNSLLSATNGNALLKDLSHEDEMKFENALSYLDVEHEKIVNVHNLLFGE